MAAAHLGDAEKIAECLMPFLTCRLYQTKAGEEGEFKLDLVNLKFDEQGREQWVPVKQVGDSGGGGRGRGFSRSRRQALCVVGNGA